MADRVSSALELTRKLRGARALGELAPASRAAFTRDLDRLESALGGDAYATVLDVLDLESKLRGGSSSSSPAGQSKAPAPAPPPAAPPARQTAEIGARAAATLEAIDFPGFVASLLTGTFQAIVDASAQQIRSYAELVASLTQSLDDFSAEKVSDDQARQFLADRHPKELVLVLPAPGTNAAPRLAPRPAAEGSSPAWLGKYGLAGEELTAELANGLLVTAGRRQVGEDRLQTLATMVLMGVNRVVVSDGNLRAKLQFHAAAMDRQRVDVDQQQAGVAGRAVSSDTRAQMMVSTTKVNAQADAAIKAELLGEVRIAFRTETFPLERFADSAAIQLINRHARWQGPPSTGAPAAPAPTPPPSDGGGGEPT
ncbi:MAG: hypothetical protein KF773_30680 [Deltaproteobacteria bacterium]|nr:hypothetical protein [Deltaproteobacteria bacterium]MCW5807140.1 hypothetical protein [Deltaproteobacteria bacterium]